MPYSSYAGRAAISKLSPVFCVKTDINILRMKLARFTYGHTLAERQTRGHWLDTLGRWRLESRSRRRSGTAPGAGT